MKKLSLLLLSVFLIGLVSCKKETVDVSELLTTVPSSAAGVVVFNMEGMLKDAGCKIKDHDIIPGEEVKKLFDNASPSNKELMILFEGNTGIEPKGAVIFYDTNRAFLTFALYDTDKFCSFVEKHQGTSFINGESGVKMAGNIAVKGAQAWICLTSGKRIDTDAIASYASLVPSQSFLVTPMGEKLLSDEEDIRGWGRIDVFLNNMLGVRDKNMATLGLGFLFEGAEAVKFSADFKKGEAEAEVVLLNSKGKPAKYQLPDDKVDVATLKSLGSTCDAMMAFTVTPKLVKKFDQLSSAFGGILFGSMGDMFKNIDGTVGLVSCGTRYDQSVNGVITTKGEVSKSLKDMIADYTGSVNEDGKYLRFTKGDVKGNLSVEECAAELKGSCLGIIYGADNDALGDVQPKTQGFKWFMMKLKPEDGGIEFEFEAKTTDPQQNALICILKNM